MSDKITSMSLHFLLLTTGSVYFVSEISLFLVNCLFYSTSSHLMLFSFSKFTNLHNPPKAHPPPSLFCCPVHLHGSHPELRQPWIWIGSLNTERIMNYLTRIGHLQQQSWALSKLRNNAKQKKNKLYYPAWFWQSFRLHSKGNWIYFAASVVKSKSFQ